MTAVVVLVLIGLLAIMSNTPVYAPEDTSTYVPVKSSEQVVSPVAGEEATSMVQVTELDQEVKTASDLNNSLSDLDAVDIDYLDTLAGQNDTEAAEF